MAHLSADSIKAARPRMVAVPVPEWGDAGSEVMVRGMSGTQRFAYEDNYSTVKDVDNRARLSAFTLCDEAGELLFTPDQIPELARADSIALDRVFMIAVELNSLSRKSLEDLSKNSSTGRTEPSVTG
jgi:hypothetical protein